MVLHDPKMIVREDPVLWMPAPYAAGETGRDLRSPGSRCGPRTVPSQLADPPPATLLSVREGGSGYWTGDEGREDGEAGR